MLVIPETTLRHVMASLVTGAQGTADVNGNRAHLKTIEESTLRSAALIALFVITGQPVVTEIPKMDRRTG